MVSSVNLLLAAVAFSSAGLLVAQESDKQISCTVSLLSSVERDRISAEVNRALAPYMKTTKDNLDKSAVQQKVYANLVGKKQLRGQQLRYFVAYVEHPSICGSGGCKAVILTEDSRNHFRITVQVQPARLPIVKIKSTSEGWNGIGISVAGGGISPPYVAELTKLDIPRQQNPTLSAYRHVQSDEATDVLITDNTCPIDNRFLQ